MTRDIQIEEAVQLVTDAVNELGERENLTYMAPANFRHELTKLVAAKMGDGRFSKAYRQEVTRTHGLIYALISTIEANYQADEIARLANVG